MTAPAAPTTAAPTLPVRRRRGPRRQRPVWDEQPTLVGRFGKTTVIVAIVLSVLFPLWVVVVTSLSDQQSITEAGGLVIVPQGLTLRAYREILSGGVVTRAVLVSLGITFVGTAIALVVNVLAAYGLSRHNSFGHRVLLMAVLVTFLFTPPMIPRYLVVMNLGMLNSYWSLMLPSAVIAFNLVVMRAFFQGIPTELTDSARVDGASEFRILLSIVLPLSRAVVAVIGLFYAVHFWNSFFDALLYMDDNTKWPLQLVLRAYVLQGQAIPGVNSMVSGLALAPVPTLAVKMAVVVIATVPVMLVYPFVQKHFTKGVLIGAVKG